MMNNLQTDMMQDRTQDLQVSAMMRKVYGWMAGGLTITALTAMIVAGNAAFVYLVFSSKAVLWTLLLGELALVIWLSAAINRLSFTKATLLYIAYSLLNGVTLSSVLLAYTQESVTSTFFVAAIMFGVTAFYGMVTKKDLSGIGHYALMALIGLILASVVNIFLHSSSLGWIISLVGVVLFVGLTAYDSQKIRALLSTADSDNEMTHKLALLGALTLYLDFINLFLYLLRFLGKGRD